MKVFPEHRKIVIPYRADIENILGSLGKKFASNGKLFLSVPHDEDTVKLLRNFGINPAAPIQYYYDWSGNSPFDSQRVTADLCTTNSKVYVLSEMGVGKTRGVLFAYDWLHSIGRVGSLLVVAPLSTLVSVWENEVFENFHHLTAAVLYGDKKRRQKILAQPANIYIVNHDGVEVLHQDLWARTDINCVAIDELATYRNSRNNRWKFLKPLVNRAVYAWGMTGAPTPNEPTDAYGQIKLLTPERVGFSFKAFKDRTMRQVSQFKWVPRPEANDIVYEAMQPSVRYTRDQCFDLPPTTYSTRDIELDPKAAKLYKKMFDELAIQVRQKQITAANEGVKLSKLLQLAAGFAYDDTGKGHYVGGTSRIREIIEIINNTQNKVIVFASFRFLVELLYKVLEKYFTAESIHGDIPKAKRDLVFANFKNGLNPRVLIAHPATMSHGLTLVQADTIIWASPITSPEVYQQANARITRSGQVNNTYIVHLQATKAEAHIYSRLRNKGRMQGALLDMFEDSTQGN